MHRHDHLPSSRRVVGPFLAAILLAGSSAAQTAPAPAAAAASPDDQAVIELSPFTVNATGDVGYLAGNTLAGSRLNTSLKDTAASISVMTEEFLDDIGALSVEDALAYANNLQVDLEETTTSMTGNLIAESFPTYRVRGVKASAARNYFVWNLPASTYNIERIDESRGPNSVLFGLGSAGGIINTSTKQAKFGSDRRVLGFTAGSHDTYRATLDLNQPLVKNVLAFRLNTLWGQRNKSRHYSDSDERRLHATALYQPFDATRVRVEFERGELRDHTTRPWTMRDAVSLWNSRGRPLRPTQTAAAADGIARLNANTRRVTWIENNDMFVDLRGTLAATVPSAQDNTMIIDRNIVDYTVNPAGPGAERSTRYTNYMGSIEQKLPGRTYLHVAFNHQRYNFVGYDPAEGQSNTLNGDPNQNMPTAPGVLQPNSFAGRYYVEANWYRRFRAERFDTVRATLSNEFDTGKWGNYRWAGMAEYERSNFQRDDRREAWLGRPFNATPENANNHVYRRYYVTEGDWASYRVPRPELIVGRTDPINGTTLSSGWIQRGTNIDDDDQTLKTFLIGGQAAWFERRLIGTFGFRRDEVNLDDRGTMRDPTTNEIVVDYGTVGEFKEVARTRTLGAVWHATRNISLTYNKSTNSALPNGAHRVLPTSTRPEQGKGEGEDIGIGIDLFDGKLYFRGAYYTTSGQKETDFRSVVTIATNRNNRVLDALIDAGAITAAQADAQRINSNGAYSDRESEGWEFRLIANPTTNWRVQLNYSITDAVESNIMPEVRAWAEQATAFWGSFDQSIVTSSNITVAQEILNLQDDIEAQTSAEGLGAIGNRRHKANLFTRYSFDEGRLKGLSIGGGIVYQSKMLTGRNLATNLLQYSDPIVRTDMMIGYRLRLPWFRNVRASLQLNIDNVLDDDDPMILRRTPDDQYVRRFSVVEPRTFRLSTRVDF